MRKALGFIVALLAFGLFGLAQAPKKTEREQKSPCDSATAQSDLNQCSGEEFRNADARLNKVYASLLKQMEGEKSDTAIQKLKAAEKAWLQYRDLHCDAARYEYQGGSMSPMVWAQCMTLTTDHRIEELNAAYNSN